METGLEFKTFGYNIMLNHHLSYKLKLIGIDKFSHLIIF